MAELEADYIIVGGGSSGCVLANRLTEDPATRVILIEAGGRDRHPFIHIPAAATLLLTHPRLTWRYVTEPDAELHQRSMAFPRGRVLGGSSAINAMGHVRGHVGDYDAWVRAGCTGWSYDDLLPYFIRSEAFPDGGENRGRNGEMPVRNLADRPRLLEKLADAAKDLGFPFIPDINAPLQEGVAYYQQTRRRQRRASAATAFLRPALRRPNLTVLTDTLAKRVLVTAGRASGVLAHRGGQDIVLAARREVILAAGAIGSPHLLLRSGLGPATQLMQHGVPVIANLPGVGADLQDHFMIRMSWRLSQDRWSGNHRLRGWRLPMECSRWVLSGKGALTWATTMMALFACTDPNISAPDIQIVVGPLSWAIGGAGKSVAPYPGMTMGLWQGWPESRGSVCLKSKDPFAAPAISLRYLSAEADRQAVVRGLKLARQWANAPSLHGIVVEELQPGSAVGDDEALLDYARSAGTTVYHACGTVRMGADPRAPLDTSLRLRGVTGLRVVDASVFPTIPVCNINASVLAVAEKAADLIRGDAKSLASSRTKQPELA